MLSTVLQVAHTKALNTDVGNCLFCYLSDGGLHSSPPSLSVIVKVFTASSGGFDLFSMCFSSRLPPPG